MRISCIKNLRLEACLGLGFGTKIIVYELVNSGYYLIVG